MPKKDPQLPGFDRVTSKGAASRGATTARGNRGAGLKWRCFQCGEIQQYWARAERHSDENHHHRIEVVFA